MSLIELESGDLRATLNPSGGGTIVAFQLDRGGHFHDLLRRADSASVNRGDPLGASCFPLVPFFAFARSGRIPLEGKEWPMAPNHPSEPFPLHGDGWLAEWNVEDADDTHATLAYAHDGSSGYPFPYQARLGFELGVAALAVEVGVTNDGVAAMPAGVGLHPYFPKTADVELRAAMSGVWPEPPDPKMLGAQDLPSAWDFSAGRRMDQIELDHCFGGWDGRATVKWPNRRLALEVSTAPPLGILCVWSPRARISSASNRSATSTTDSSRWRAARPNTGCESYSPAKRFPARCDSSRANWARRPERCRATRGSIPCSSRSRSAPRP